MDLLLKDKKILVTGGSKGIGLACAKTLALEGAHLIVSSRSEQNLKQAVEQINGKFSEIHAFPADISKTDDLEALYDFVTTRFGILDGLIINSGGPPMGSALDHGDDAWFAAINSLLMPVVRLTRYFVPGMQERGYGRIISISSTGVKQPITGLVLSNSVRSSVIAFMKTLSVEVAKNNVYVNNLLPGSTNTERLLSLHESISKKIGKEH